MIGRPPQKPRNCAGCERNIVSRRSVRLASHWAPIALAALALATMLTLVVALRHLTSQWARALCLLPDKLLIARIGRRHPEVARVAIQTIERLASLQPGAAESGHFAVHAAPDGTYRYILQSGAV
jgi:hypothetical protein